MEEKGQKEKKKLVRGVREVHGGLLYDIDTATLLASDRYWDGHNWNRLGRNEYLYKTKNGRYFVRHVSYWEGENDRLEPCQKEEAKEVFEKLTEKEVTYEEAFGEEPEEA